MQHLIKIWSVFFKANGKRKEKIKKVIICGGGRVGYYLAAQLSTLGMQVKIIEENARRCEELCELLPKATIINGDATDQDLLVEEGVEEADAFVALTGMDEEISSCLCMQRVRMWTRSLQKSMKTAVREW